MALLFVSQTFLAACRTCYRHASTETPLGRSGRRRERGEAAAEPTRKLVDVLHLSSAGSSQQQNPISASVVTRKQLPSAWSERVITSVGLLASIGLGILLPVVASSTNTKVDVLLGASGFLVGYLLTMDVATRSRLGELETRLMARLDEVEAQRYGALPMQRLLTVPEIEEPIRDVVEAAANARAKRMQFLANRTVERIRRDRDETLRISHGIFRCESRQEELRLIRTALADTHRSLKAVAGLGLEHWVTPSFYDYFDTYLEYAESLAQTRIFLVTQQEMADPRMIEILDWHAEAGVDTYALDKDALPDERKAPLVLFDDGLLLSHTITRGAEIEVHFTDDGLAVRDASERFDALIRLIRRTRNSCLLWRGTSVAVIGPPVPEPTVLNVPSTTGPAVSEITDSEGRAVIHRGDPDQPTNDRK